MNDDVASSPTTQRVSVGANAPATPVRHPLERDLALRGLAGRFLEPDENGATAGDLLSCRHIRRRDCSPLHRTQQARLTQQAFSGSRCSVYRRP